MQKIDKAPATPLGEANSSSEVAATVSIPLTELATSDPLDLCKGLAIFPKLGTLRAGIANSGVSHTLLNKSATILAWRGSATLSYDLFIGICGPSFATKFRLEGRASGKSLDMKVSDDSMEAGMFIGVTLGLPISVNLQEWWPDHWYTPWQGSWHNKGNFSVNPRIDLLGVILCLILQALDDDSIFKEINTFVPGLIGAWGLIGTAGGGFSNDRGSMSATPTFNVPVNILPLIPDVGEALESMNEIGLCLATGPQFGIGVPVTLQLESVHLDDKSFPISTWTDDDSFRAEGYHDAPTRPDRLSAGFSHEPGLTFTLGWFASASLWKLFRISASVSIDILDLLGIHIKLGKYQNSLDNTVGSTRVSNCEPCQAEREAARLKVVFEDPA